VLRSAPTRPGSTQLLNTENCYMTIDIEATAESAISILLDLVTAVMSNGNTTARGNDRSQQSAAR